MNLIEVNKVLANEIRFEILFWLKNPKEHFPKQHIKGDYKDGVCVQYIGQKSGLSLSTISHYLSMMQKAGLLVSSRFGKWTYYKRDEEGISNYVNLLKEHLLSDKTSILK
ncbi:MAG: ArsR/SmtB family transcription factor [Saprospiraceae bacterium]